MYVPGDQVTFRHLTTKQLVIANVASISPTSDEGPPSCLLRVGGDYPLERTLHENAGMLTLHERWGGRVPLADDLHVQLLRYVPPEDGLSERVQVNYRASRSKWELMPPSFRP